MNVWAAVVGDHVIGPVFLRGPVNAQSYVHFLTKQLPNLLDELPDGAREHLIFMQDGHPAHTSRAAVEVLN